MLETELNASMSNFEFDGKTLENSEVQKFYDNTVVFLTGGSGFVGRILTEKLLRSCPNISKIYLLLREKKSKSAAERFQEVFDDVVYDRVRKCNEKLFHKIEFIHGDCFLPDLGLSSEDKQKLIEEVNIIFHAAATVKFDEKLTKAIPINVRATRDLLQIATKMKNLKSTVYVSTAYSFCTHKEIDERVYDLHINADKLIKMFEVLNETEMDAMKSHILGKFPNTYVLTKAVAENYVKELSQEIPISIVRPSIGTASEPVVGWINNFYGVTGILTGAGVGLLRTMLCDKDKICDMVPVDYVANTLIVAATKVINKKKITEESQSDEVQVYNYIGSEDWPITFEMFKMLVYKHAYQIPSMACIWHYFFYLNKSKFVHIIFGILFHYIPAYLVDTVTVLLGNKPRMIEAYKKIDSFLEPVSYFALRQWKFSNKNVRHLWNSLNETDQKLFPFDLKVLEWDSYIYQYVRGVRVYLLKDPMETLPKSNRRYFKLKVLHYVILNASFLAFIYLVFLGINCIFKFF